MQTEAELKAAADAEAQASAEAEAAEKAAAEAKAKTDAAAAAAAEADKTPPAGTPGDKTPPAEDPAAVERRRFSELSARVKAAEREKEDANRRLGQALEAVERLTGQAPGSGKQKADAEDPEPQAPAFESPEQFQRDSAQYARNLAEWTSRRAVAAGLADDRKRRIEESQQETTKRVSAEFSKRRAEAIARLPDYVEVAENPELPITEHMAAALTVDADGPDLAYYLGQNRQDAERIAALSPGQQLIELGVLKAKVVAARASRTVTRAPAPIKPQGPGSTQTKPITDDSVPMDEYAAKRNEQIAAERRPGTRR
jgi:hypothetical protein